MKLTPEVHDKVCQLVERFFSFREYTSMESSLSIESVFDALESVVWNYELVKDRGLYSVTVTTGFDVINHKKLKEFGATRMEALVNVLYAVVKDEDNHGKH